MYKMLVLVVPLLIKLSLSDISLFKEKEEFSTDVQAVEGKRASLPCDVYSLEHDKVYMVLWFQQGSGYPIYSFDVRGKPLSQARHWSSTEVFGPRAYFQTVLEPAQLVIQDVQRQDEGVYRCRVDFQNAQTRSFQYNLTVIVPPEIPLIFDKWGREVNGTIGPVEEGDDVTLTCRAVGGKPEPIVRWIVNGKLVDTEYEHNAGDVIENRIVWSNVSRKDLNTTFTCQTENTKLAEPKEAIVVLELWLKPLTLQIRNFNETMIANEVYEIVCESEGSRPSALISWYKGNQQLKQFKEETTGNYTISELSFTPTIEDHDKFITCRAENSNLTGLFLETSRKMNVTYAPIIDLSLGSTLNAYDVKEGDDVYFECKVKANPPWKRLSWYFNGDLLQHNMSSRILHSNQSLVLQKVNKENSGFYKCSAANNLGETASNELFFSVQYVPICSTKTLVTSGALLGEEIFLKCEVESYPPVTAFKWRFNNSGETFDIDLKRYVETSNGSLSILRYKPLSETDYGFLSCWANNKVGQQGIPCVFHVIEAGKPLPVKNCTAANQHNNSFEIVCTPGSDSSIPQHFVLESYTQDSLEPKFNITSWTKPQFYLKNLEQHPYRILIYAVNAKGRSKETGIDIRNFQNLEKVTSFKKNLGISSIFGIIIGAVLTVFLILSIILGQAKKEKSDCPILITEKNVSTALGNYQLSPCQRSITISMLSKPMQDRDPDVIPANYGTSDYLVVQFNDFQGAPTTMLVDSPSCISDFQLPNIFNSSLFLEQYLQYNNPVFMVSTISGKSKLTNWLLTNHEFDLNGDIIKEKLMASRLPESCV